MTPSSNRCRRDSSSLQLSVATAAASRRVFMGVCSALVGCGLFFPAAAQTTTSTNQPSQNPVYDYSGATHTSIYCQITVTTTATLLTTLLSTASCPTIPPWSLFAFITPEASSSVALRYRADSTAPTASVGVPIFGYSTFPIQSASTLQALSLISATGSSVTTDVEFRW